MIKKFIMDQWNHEKKKDKQMHSTHNEENLLLLKDSLEPYK